MRDFDAERHFMEQVHYVMSKCKYCKEIDGIGVCSLNVLPCKKILYKGECEAVAEWYQNKGGDSEK